MLKFGNISNIDYEKGLARVKFNEDGIVSKYLPISVRKTLVDKETFPYCVNEQVWCLMDENAENGVIGGAIYSKDTKPKDAGEGITAIEYSNGTRFEYDKVNNTFKIKIDTAEQIISPNGHTIKKGTDTLKAIMTAITDAALADTFPTAMGPTGTTLNLAAWQAVKTKINNLFEN